jgi:hypothetical protein
LNAWLDDESAVRGVQTGNWQQSPLVNRCHSMM